jgi:uncharacterized OsmC-like protein
MEIEILNGINRSNLSGFAEKVTENKANGIVGFEVETEWKGGTKSEARVTGWKMAGQKLEKDFVIHADEPVELLGENTAPNPQELFLAAMNACMTVGYVATAAMMGVTLTKLQIRASGDLDLRGFLGLDNNVKPGYDEISYEVTMDGDGTPEQFEQIHETVTKTSPNRWNVANSIKLNASLKIPTPA